MSHHRTMRSYQSSLILTGDARIALCAGVYALVGDRFNPSQAPRHLISRVRDLPHIIRASREVIIEIERASRDLIASFETDLSLWVNYRLRGENTVRSVRCVWRVYQEENQGDLEVESALAALWSGRLWAPLHSVSQHLSLSPMGLIDDEEEIEEIDDELELDEALEIARLDRDLGRWLNVR